MCVVIYIFGDARQLYPYELARPHASLVPKTSDTTLQLKESYPSHDDEEGLKGIVVSPSMHPDSPTKELKSPTSSTAPTSAGFISPFLYNQTMYGSGADAPMSPPSTSSSSPATTFDFDALPPLNSQLSPEALKGKSKREKVPVFTPLTKVLSPEITRAQWEIMVRSAILGVFVAVVLGAVCIAVPAKAHSR